MTKEHTLLKLDQVDLHGQVSFWISLLVKVHTQIPEADQDKAAIDRIEEALHHWLRQPKPKEEKELDFDEYEELLSVVLNEQYFEPILGHSSVAGKPESIGTTAWTNIFETYALLIQRVHMAEFAQNSLKPYSLDSMTGEITAEDVLASYLKFQGHNPNAAEMEAWVSSLFNVLLESHPMNEADRLGPHFD